MKEKIPINPAILVWARESANLLVEDVALKMNKSPDAIEAWEKGDSSQTYVQLETLAYTLYKRPVAIFFFPEPPEVVTAKKSFRTLPESELEELAPTFLRVFRRGQAMQINLEELTNGENPAEKKILKKIQKNTKNRQKIGTVTYFSTPKTTILVKNEICEICGH